MSDTAMVPALVCERWRLMLPEYRALRHVELPFWEKPRLDSMHANLRAGDVVYDVGTEDGDLSALFATWVTPGWVPVPGTEPQAYNDGRLYGGGVVLIEPNPRVWPSIRAIWEANNLEPPLAYVVGFAGDEAHESADWDDEHRWPTRRTTGGWPSCSFGPLIPAHGFLQLGEEPDCPVVTIDYLAEHTPPPTAITLDCEGAELHVLRGARETLRDRRPLVWVSIHPEFMREQYGQDPQELVAMMSALGYRREHLAAEHEWHTFFYPEERTVRLPYGGSR